MGVRAFGAVHLGGTRDMWWALMGGSGRMCRHGVQRKEKRHGKTATEKDGDYRHAADCVSSAGNGRNVPLQERGPGGGQAGAGEADQHERLERGGPA